MNFGYLEVLEIWYIRGFKGELMVGGLQANSHCLDRLSMMYVSCLNSHLMAETREQGF